MSVTFANHTRSEQHANASAFVLQDSAGIKRMWRPLIGGACPSWDAVNLTAGATFGPRCLSFEAAAGHPAGLTLIWSSGLFSGDHAIRLS